MAKRSLKKKTHKKSSTIAKIRKEIKKEPEKKINKKYLSTGCTLVDLVVGGGEGLGFPLGKIINVVGDSSSGKTFLCNEIVASNYHKLKNKLEWNYDDAETGHTFDTKKLFSMEIINKDTLKSITVEEFDVNVKRFMKKRLTTGKIGIYVLDTLDGLGDSEKQDRAEERYKQAEAGKEIENKGTYGTSTPKFLSQEFFKTKTYEVEKKNMLLIIISQVRENLDPGMFKKKFVRAGGRALNFYAHTCLWLATTSKIVKKDRVIGVIVKAKTEKSKTPRPFRTCKFIIYFDYGVDDIGSNLNYLYDCWSEKGTLKESSNNIMWDGSKKETLISVKEFLKERNLLEKCRKDKEKKTKKKNLSISFVKEWLTPELTKEYNSIFGKPYTYNELISKIENDPKLIEKLKKRVIEKWESEEKEISNDRVKKY
ncbi:MAG: hypothetical protein ACFFDN_02045 [Candidatus Hodarchaeota archaeon]